MIRKLFMGWLLAGVLLAAPGVMLAHHSDANFDKTKVLTLHGIVTEFRFVNPHPHIYFQVKDKNGNVEDWIAETGSPPARMYNAGWKANALKPGDEVTVTGNPDKEGRKLLRVRKIVSPNGHEWEEGQ